VRVVVLEDTLEKVAKAVEMVVVATVAKAVAVAVVAQAAAVMEEEWVLTTLAELTALVVTLLEVLARMEVLVVLLVNCH
jgi:hypothetical protein